MDALFKSEILVAKRKKEWDSLFARISTYTDSKELVYSRKRNIQFTSLKHGFRKRFTNCKKQTRPRKLAFEVQDLDIDESDTEVLSDDSSIYSANDELESDISDSESVNSVQYVLQCNEQRKLPDFNTKVENCQTYMLQNACFNQGLKENNANVCVDNSSVNTKALLCEMDKVNEASSFLEEQIPTHCSASKSLFANQNIEIDTMNPVDNVQITDQSKISHSGNKQLKSILSRKMSGNSSKINKKITFSSDPDSEIDIDEFESDDGSETEQHISKNSNLSTLESTKTLSTNNIAVNNKVNVIQLNIQKVNNLEKAIHAIKTNEKPKIYSTAARKKRQLSVNTGTERNTSKNTVDEILEIKIAKSKTKTNTALNEILYNSSKETHINNERVAKLTENESLVEINQCNKQNGELRTKTPSKHKETAKNKCNIIFSTELDCSDNESSILRTNLKETFVKNEDTNRKKIPCSYLSSSSSESDTELFVNHAIIDLKSNNFEKGKNKENTLRNEYSKNISNKENQTLYKQVNYIKSNSEETPTIRDLTTTINSVSKLKNVTPKDICRKLFSKADSSNPLLKETSIDNSKEEHNKENTLPKANSTRIKRKELNKKITEKRKIPKNIGMKIFSTETHCSDSECNLILKSKSNVLTDNTFDKNNFIKNNTTDKGEANKQYLISSTPNINAIRQKSSQEQCLKEINVDDEIAELFSCDQSTILNEEHMNSIQKNEDENSSENDDEIFETIKNEKPSNFSRKQVKYNMTNINTTANDNYEDITMSSTVVHLRYNKNGQKVITDSKHNGILDMSSWNEIVNKVQPNTLIKSSRKKKSTENILASPTLSTKSNSKIIKCRQRLFNSSSENDNDNCTIQLNSTVLTAESLNGKQDDREKENSEDLNKDNQTQSLPETADIISKLQSKSINEKNSILQNHRKRKLEDSNCGSVKQLVKKHCKEQVTLNKTTENNVKRENKNCNNYNTIVQQSINDEENTKYNVQGKKNGKKRRSKCKKEIRFISYSTDTNDEDKMWSISSIKNRTPLSLEYFLDDDVF